MGNIVNSGKNNDDLVDILKFLGYIKSKKVERVFRAVDRGDYVLASHRDLAYKDLSWKVGNIHLSAPCVYGKVLEGLSLKSGLSFLNIGSGTGYLSTMAGLILNHQGTNHGIEVNLDCLEYAYKKLDEFKRESLALDEFDFCEPVFIHGNCLNLVINRQYDRVYCGAACPESHESILKQFVKIGGILVMPYKDQLLRIVRESENSWRPKAMLPTSFAGLVIPKSEDRCVLHLPYSEPLSLQELCRFKIRAELRKIIWVEHPELELVQPIVRMDNRVAFPASQLLPNGILSLHTGGIELSSSGEDDTNDENLDGIDDEDYDDEYKMVRMRFFDFDSNIRQKRVRTVSPKNTTHATDMTSLENRSTRVSSECLNENLAASTSQENEEVQENGNTHSAEMKIKNINEQSSSAMAVGNVRCELVNNIAHSYQIESAMDTDDMSLVEASPNGYRESDETPDDTRIRTLEYEPSSDENTSDDDDLEARLMEMQNARNHEQWGINENSFGSDISPKLQSVTGSARTNRDSKPVQVFAHNVHIKAFSAHMRKKILDLPLPMSLRMYINRNV